MNLSFGFRRVAIFIVAVLFEVLSEQNDAHQAASGVSDGSRPNDAVDGDGVLKEEHQGDVDDAFSKKSKNQGAVGAADGLEERDDHISDRRERGADAEDAEEGGPIGKRAGFVILDEDGSDGACPNQIYYHR